MAHQESRVLSLVQSIRGQIDEVFAMHVGPIAGELCRDEFARWLNEGHIGPLALNRYIARLGQYITDETERRTFMVNALKCIRNGTGK